jgi:shikimate dehydrogenase
VTCALEGVGACVSVISRKGPDTYADLAQRHRDALLVVNATPVGMYPACPASALPEATLAALPQLEGVLDVVYNPHRTGICLAAGHLGIPYESGLAMLVAQARFSSELFQGTALPDDAVTSIERDIMRQTTSVFLIGMPGSGKTGAGRRLARLLSRPFVDLDDAAVLEAGCDIPSYFERHGEAAFRDLETKVLATYAGQSGLVIACGGGVVERPENLDLLRQNGLVVMLDRALDELACDGRPVTAARGVDSIAASRMPLYRSWSDLVIRCTGSAEGDAEKIVRLLGAWPDDGPAHSICT